MKNKKKIIWAVCCIIVLIGIIFLISINVNNKNNTNIISEGNNEVSKEDMSRRIRLSEDLDIEGKIENLENAKWNHVIINEDNNKLQLMIDVNNESKTDVIPTTELTVNVLDKNEKTILTKKVQMKEISNEYGFTILNLDFDIDEPVIVYNIEIIANT